MDRGRAIYEELKKAGIRYLIWVPDSETHFMHEAIENDRDIRYVKVCREAEAIPLCAGLHVGGVKAALLVENQGAFEFGNELKWAAALGFPIVMLIGYLMHREMERTSRGMMFHGIRDYTEPFFDAFGITRYLVERDADVSKVAVACEEAHRTKRPVAVLLTSADGYTPGG